MNELISKYKFAPITLVGAMIIVLSQRAIMGELDPAIRAITAVTGLIIMSSAVALEMWSYLAGIKGATIARKEMVTIARKAAKEEVGELHEEVDGKIQDLRSPFSEHDIESVKKVVIENLSGETLERIEEYFSKADADRDAKERNRIALRAKTTMRLRLKDEIEELGRRANLNLVIGSTISILGMVLLAYFIYVANEDFRNNINPGYFVLKFGARLSLVIFMQVFAYFFLRLYRYSIFEIKYFQNEMTNIELWILSLQVATRGNDEKIAAQILSTLVKVERNFRLKKGETTVGLQREELEARYEAAMMGHAEKITDKMASILRGGRTESRD